MTCASVVTVKVCARACVCVRARPTVWDLHLSVADQLTGEEGLGMSVLDECVLYHLHHAKSRLDRPDNHNRGSRDHRLTFQLSWTPSRMTPLGPLVILGQCYLLESSTGLSTVASSASCHVTRLS